MDMNKEFKPPVLFNPSKPVAALIIALAIVFTSGPLILFKLGYINVITFMAVFVGAISVALEANQCLGIKRILRDSSVYKGEVIFCVPSNAIRKSFVPDFYIIEFSYMKYDGTRQTAKWHFKEPKRIGEFTDIYLNGKTGEIVEKSVLDKSDKQCRKRIGTIIGIAAVVVAIISEALNAEMSSDLLKMKLGAIPVLALMLLGGGYLVRFHFHTKHEMEMTVKPIIGTVKEYIKRGAFFHGILVEGAYSPNISYWDYEERIFECKSYYSRTKYPVGSEIKLYRDEKGKIYEAKSLYGILPLGIFSLILAAVLFYFTYIYF